MKLTMHISVLLADKKTLHFFIGALNVNMSTRQAAGV